MADDPTPLKPQCEDALHEIYHLLAGELDDHKRHQITQHLEQCSPCAEPYDFYAELRRTVQQRCRDTAPPSLLARIEAAIQHEPH
ncbi:MAG TPA: mycothiol system anti-sigma-R factor [Acidimicrobiales bacterium]|nr:mycothiol system anti-sigma-R factor [Acidimicrobiales bacterium]